MQDDFSVWSQKFRLAQAPRNECGEKARLSSIAHMQYVLNWVWHSTRSIILTSKYGFICTQC